MTSKTVSAQLAPLYEIAAQFSPQHPIQHLESLGHGNVNDTYLVTTAAPQQFVLQRVNTRVFQQPALVMQNMQVFCQHVRDRLPQRLNQRPWKVPEIWLTGDQQTHWLAPDGSFWRAMSFIDGTQSLDTLQSPHHAYEVGVGLGLFHALLSDLPISQLADTLEGFHITPRYLAQYQQTVSAFQGTVSPEVQHCMDFIQQRQDWAGVLEQAKADGKLPLRPIHGDPKVNNILLDQATGQAISMIDLDTVKPGLIHYDIGDCLRSGCNRLGEETPDWQSVQFDLDLARALLDGYLSQASSFLTDYDYDYLYDACRLIAFELGLRFFTDHLAGDRYFKVHYPGHNLARALVQFQLTQSIEDQSAALHSLIQELR